MHRLTAFARLTVSAVVAAAALAGCVPGEMTAFDSPDSVADMAPRAAVRAGLEATKAAGPVVYTGQVQQFFAGAARPLDAEMTVDGEDCDVALTSDDLGSIRVRVVDEHVYMRATAGALEQLLELSKKEAAAIGDRWVGSPRPDDLVCDPVEIAVGELDLATCTAGGDEMVEGTATVFVRCRNAFEQRIYLATEGPPVLVRVEDVGMGASHLTLVERDPDARIEAPPDAEVIDLTDVA